MERYSVSTAPLKPTTGLNGPPAYAGNDPVNLIDPLGLSADEQSKPVGPQSIDEFLSDLRVRIPGTSTYNVGGTYYIVFPAGMSYDQVTNALENAGYYTGLLAYDPLFHPLGQEFRTTNEGPGFHFKVAYPDQMPVACSGCPDGIGSQDVPGPVVGTDVHIDNPNPIPVGWNTFSHGVDFFKAIWRQLSGR